MPILQTLCICEKHELDSFVTVTTLDLSCQSLQPLHNDFYHTWVTFNKNVISLKCLWVHQEPSVIVSCYQFYITV